MYTETNFGMAKGKNFQSDNFILSLRLKGAEAMRFWAIFDTAKQRNPYAERTDVIRELLGLDKLNLLTKEDLQYFQSGEKHAETLAEPKALPHEHQNIANAEGFADAVVLPPDSIFSQLHRERKKKKAG